jgi:hypothetical protein
MVPGFPIPAMSRDDGAHGDPYPLPVHPISPQVIPVWRVLDPGWPTIATSLAAPSTLFLGGASPSHPRSSALIRDKSFPISSVPLCLRGEIFSTPRSSASIRGKPSALLPATGIPSNPGMSLLRTGSGVASAICSASPSSSSTPSVIISSSLAFQTSSGPRSSSPAASSTTTAPPSSSR